MSQISGPGGVGPKPHIPTTTEAAKVSEHVEAEQATAALTHVLEVLKSVEPHQSPDTLYSHRLNELEGELRLLRKMEQLVREKPSGYEGKMEAFLRPGETVAQAEQNIQLEIQEVQEKMRAVKTAKVLTENPD